MARESNYCWEVKHPDYGTAVVIAPDLERATVAAAEFWGVKWAKIACDCKEVNKFEVRTSVCQRCGHRMYNQPIGICDKCRKIIQIENEQIKRNLQKTWYLDKKTKAGRT